VAAVKLPAPRPDSDRPAAAAEGPRAGEGLWWLPAAVLALGLLLAFMPTCCRLSQPLVDAQRRWLAPSTPPAKLLVIDIDDASLAALEPQYGPWPFRRDVYASTIDQLRDLGARAIAIDVLLADARPGDAALARTIGRAGAPVVLGAAGLRQTTDSTPPAAARSFAASLGTAPALAWPTIVLPSESVWPAAGAPPRTGVITTPLDDDGTLRRLPLWHEAQGQRWPALPLAVWQAVQGDASKPPWPLDADGYARLTFAGADGAPTTVPFVRLARVARGEEDAGALGALVHDSVVFIGSSASLGDTVFTVAGQLGSTSALAQAYAALRDDTLLRAPPAWAQALPLALALVPALVIGWRGRTAPARDAMLALTAAVALALLTLALLTSARMPVLTLAPLAMLAATLALSLWVHERWLARQTQRLEHERAVAAAASRAKSEFLANVSHEMRTPMNALLGVAELLAETPLDTEQRRHVQVFRQSGQTLHALINDLLDLAKIESGRFELEAAPFVLREALERLMSMLRTRAQQKGLAFDLVVADDVPAGLLADRQRLVQALTNLLGNAIKFTASGGITLAVQREGERMLRLDVRDTGIGIAPSKREQIFEPFAQADGSITRLYGGTGLGLAITRSIAGLMGGRIEVTSTPGMGSVFSLVVPLVEAELAPPVPDSHAGLALRAPARVLLAEDNEVNVYVFQAMLDGEPARVDVAGNGPTALAMAEQHAYDIIFMDVQMPGMDGLTVTRRLREFEATHGRRRTPVVALTANAYEDDVRESAGAGCDRHLSKPFAKRELLEAIAELALVPAPAADVIAAPTPAAIDEASALALLGGDQALYRRVREHAAPFIERWSEDFDLALREGRRDRLHALAHDLAGIAASIGASVLSQAAQRLDQSIRSNPDGRPDTDAYAAVREAAAPVIVALSRPA